MPTDNRHLVFVYGSLLKGLHNHVLIEDAEFVSRGHTGPGLGLLDLGSFPGLVPDRDCPGVWGELYRVDDATLAQLDRLEGVDHHHPDGGLYRRDVLAIRPLAAHASAYLYNLHGRGYRLGLLVPPGTGEAGLVDWRGHLAAREEGAVDWVDEDGVEVERCDGCAAEVGPEELDDLDPTGPILCPACRA
jgi:gamma-glutamylcyclotransferase (GGCT)/AIG2-like uncharacterized protein YtfP